MWQWIQNSVGKGYSICTKNQLVIIMAFQDKSVCFCIILAWNGWNNYSIL